MERRIPIYLVEGQTRFEPWAKEDGPSLINPKSLKIDAYRRSDFDDLAMVYMSVFNAQNKRKYANIPNAILAGMKILGPTSRLRINFQRN